MSTTTLRTLGNREEETLLRILESAYGSFHSETEVRALLSSRSVYHRARFDPDGCFIAEADRSPVGSVAVTTLPRRNGFVIRYLAVARREKKTEITEALLTKATDYTRSRNSEYVRATTPSFEPYVGIYKKLGFVPVRRDLRISWDLRRLAREEKTVLKVEEVAEERSREAARFFVGALSPLWDWRTDEQGGPSAVADSFCEGLKRGERWFLCYANDEIVGLTGMIVDYYKPGAARFRGAYVVPEYRGRGIGLAVMNEALNLARRARQNRMVVYTFSYLDCLAPGALLYLRSGGQIEAEYTQLVMP